MTTSSSELKRSLSMSKLIFMGLVFIGPLAPIGIFGTLDAKSNGAVATVYLVATFALALTGSSYMRMSREVPRADSVFAYANAGIGPRTGNIAGWMILLDYVLVPSIAFMIAGIGMAFCAMVGQAAGTRILLDMSRSGQLPTALSKVSAKRQVPSLAVIVVASCSIGVSLWTSTRPDGLDLLSSLVNMGALVAFVLLHASVIGYYLVRQKASVRGHMQGEGHLRVALSFLPSMNGGQLGRRRAQGPFIGGSCVGVESYQ
ncbi:amino acid permease [Rothia amarae]|uniref:amino acid permease n=1 Tax=Rothia amarae TaxID=169480 RepID=UPI0012463317